MSSPLRFPKHLAASLLVAWLAGSLSCVTNPATGKKMFSLIGEESEANIGKEADPGIRAQYGVYGDEAVTSYVQDLGMTLARKSERPDLDWHFTVLDSPVVNAFALPGGYIYVTRGLLAHANSEAQLAGVIGHEIGHVTARHSARQMSQQQLLGVGIAVASIASENAAFADLANAGAGLFLLRHSRDHERQSDELGIRYMVRAKYDPRELPGFFDVLDRLQTRAGGGDLPNWLSTHPAPENRVVDTRSMAKQRVKNKGPSWAPTVGRDRFLGVIDGLVFGEDPRQGYFEGNVFFHPEMRFTLAFPRDWVTLNRPTQVLAADDEKRATALLRLSAGRAREGESPGAYLQRRVARLDGVSLAGGADETVNGLPAFLGRLTVRQQDGSRERRFVAAVAKGGSVFEFVGQTAPGRYADHEPTFRRTVRSFAELTDRAKLSVRQKRIAIRRAGRAQSFTQYLDGQGSLAVPRQELAILNQLRQADRVESGHSLKVVD
jgi:predicted Zn-dependent protease